MTNASSSMPTQITVSCGAPLKLERRQMTEGALRDQIAHRLWDLHPYFSLLRFGASAFQDRAETNFAGDHALVSIGRAFERKSLDHRADVVGGGEFERIFGIGGGA